MGEGNKVLVLSPHILAQFRADARDGLFVRAGAPRRPVKF